MVSASCLSRSSSTKPLMSSRPRSSVIALGWNLRASASVPDAGGGDHALEARLPREIEQDRGEGDVVLDDQHERLAVQRCRGRR